MPAIRISHYSFVLSDPFQAGHVLSENEARALNALRAENIRNSLALAVRSAAEAYQPGELLPQQELARLTELAAKYDSEYSFGSRRSYTRSSPLETTAREIARARVVSNARVAGLVMTPEQLEQQTAHVALHPDVQEEARQRIGEQERISAAALESLL